MAENLALNTQLDERRRLVRWKEVRAIAERALSQIGVDIDLDRPVERLPVADKQLVAIARALLRDARLVILDEPTTALTRREVARLFEIIKRMQASGISALFVSHKLREVLEISERITILRNGQKVREGDVSEFDERKIIYHMTGRELAGRAVHASTATGKRRVLEVSGLGCRDKFQDVTFDLCEGEILGITGLLGSGRTELALSLFGVKPYDRGTVRVDGVERRIDSIQRAIRAGIAYVPEDRVSEGLFLPQSIARNMSVSVLGQLRGRGGLLDFSRCPRPGAGLGQEPLHRHPRPGAAGPVALRREPAAGGAGALALHQGQGADPERPHGRRGHRLQGRHPRQAQGAGARRARRDRHLRRPARSWCRTATACW